MTERERDVLDAIRRLTVEKGYPPTIRELCSACGFASTNGARNVLTKLERAGLIERDRIVSRGIRVLVDGAS